MSESNKKHSLMEELEELFQEMTSKLKKASFLGKSMADKFVPIEKILIFVGKLVQKVEKLEEQNAFLMEELGKMNEELAKQNTMIQHLDSDKEAGKRLGISL